MARGSWQIDPGPTSQDELLAAVVDDARVPEGVDDHS